MGQPFQYISFKDNQRDFLQELDKKKIAGIFAADQYTLINAYNVEYFGNTFQDISFCLTKGEQLSAFVFAHVSDGTCSFYDRGALMFFSTPNKKLIRAAFEHLLESAKNLNLEEVKIYDPDISHVLSDIGAEAFNFDGNSICRCEAIIDLALSEEEIHRGLRKSYKSLINDGRRNIDYKYITKENPDEDLFDEFRKFHIEVSGRETRSKESWDIQLQTIKAGYAELSLGYIESHGLVSAAFFDDYGDTTLYSTAVYDRNLFNKKPLAHASVYEGILRAKQRGQKTFYLGYVGQKGTIDDKYYDIGKFKKGFCDRLNISLEWTVPVTGIQK